MWDHFLFDLSTSFRITFNVGEGILFFVYILNVFYFFLRIEFQVGTWLLFSVSFHIEVTIPLSQASIVPVERIDVKLLLLSK